MAENQGANADNALAKVDGIVEILCNDAGDEAKMILHSPLNGGKGFTEESVKK